MRRVIIEEDNVSVLRDHSISFQKSCSKEKRQEHGIYFTPQPARNRIFSLLEEIEAEPISVLEPSCGSGEFILDVLHKYPNASVTGIELNTDLARLCLEKCPRATIIEHDFLNWTSDTTYDLIIGNPPYFVLPLDHLSSKEKKAFQQKYSECMLGRPNAFILFIYKCLSSHLSPGGILAFIISTSLLNSSYYQPLRKYMAARTTILALENITDPGFYDTKQDTMLIMLRNTPSDDQAFFFNRNNQLFLNPHDVELHDLVKDKPCLQELGWSVKTGTITWNEIKDKLAEEGTLLLYSGNIKCGKITLGVNLPKKQYVQGVTKPIQQGPCFVVARGYGNAYHFDYAYLEQSDCYIENHLNIVYPITEEAKKHSDRINASFRDERMVKFISLYCGNGQLSATELETVVPIF